MSDRRFALVFLAVLAAAGVAPGASVGDFQGDEIPLIQDHDLVGFNSRVAAARYGVGIPHVPSEQLTSSDGVVRAFTQSNTSSGIAGFDAALWNTDASENKPLGALRFNLTQSPSDWFGLNWDGDDKVSRVLTVGDIYDAVKTYEFVFTFDQNQSKNGNQIPDDDLPPADDPFDDDPDVVLLPEWENNYIHGPDGNPIDFDPGGGVVNIEAAELTEDIWLKGRLLLVSPDVGLEGKTEALVRDALFDSGLDILTLEDHPTGAETGTVVALYFDDTTFGDYEDGEAFYLAQPQNPHDDPAYIEPPPDDESLARNWVHLPGTTYWDSTDPANPFPFEWNGSVTDPGLVLQSPSTTQEISNNGSAGWGDWAGFVGEPGSPFDFSSFEDWQFLLEMQCIYDDSGKEEVYIVSYGTSLAPPIPEPFSALLFLGGVVSLGGYLRRRL